MRITGQTRLAGVTGDPVAHSLSPLMMSHWIAASGLDAAYLPFPVAPTDFSDFVRGLAKSPSVSGLNVTLPHKEAALALADKATPAALAIGAANLLTFRGGEIHADNTDADGFLAALEPAEPDYGNAIALVLGAGGAARALVHALLTSGCATILLSNRTRSRCDRGRNRPRSRNHRLAGPRRGVGPGGPGRQCNLAGPERRVRARAGLVCRAQGSDRVRQCLRPASHRFSAWSGGGGPASH